MAMCEIILSMKPYYRLIIIIALAVLTQTGCNSQDEAARIAGAGASFPGPVYRAWAAAYNSRMGGEVVYVEVGSSEGIARIKTGAVDYGASDMPLSQAELERHGLIQVPALIGGVTVVVNLPGIKPGDLVFSGEILADLFLGNIRSWSDPALKKLNPDLRLPDRPITIVHRSDGSGTAWLFSRYLSTVSTKWRTGPGCGDRINWPNGVGAQRNAGVLRKVMETPGSVGYVNYTFAREAGVAFTSLINASGKAVAPSLQTFYAAVGQGSANTTNGTELTLVNLPGTDCWPIAGATYLLLKKDIKGGCKARSIVRFLTWCYDEGGDVALRLNYIPLSARLAEASIKKLRTGLLASP